MFPESAGNSSPPPVYDDNVFDVVSELKSTVKVNFENVFASPKSNNGAFDDLLGGFGKDSKGSEGGVVVLSFESLLHFEKGVFGGGGEEGYRCGWGRGEGEGVAPSFVCVVGGE
ncbi:hypothetical protein MTR_6g038630 [Medicago truncatula]|uniref:Uncharacterized protein n=1 Tax=Medicago truncatula TaxID=3880 RepID=A0A072U890_MEDTR|nr:hypothetical protein MTR_6g038630 [Medicago truncatula]